jgi:maltooligosyltrehalose trehalohydrolase
LYEVHVGTATPEGTFDALITYFGLIRDLGATAIMLMPIAEFAGERNWGYDGVDLFAPSHRYGGPEALRRFVNAAHGSDLAVILDVVFNHSGPRGNYLGMFAEDYFSKEYSTPWGPPFNIDRVSGREVVNFLVENACQWALEYHLDGLRFDAIHAIPQNHEQHTVGEIVKGVRERLPSVRPFSVIAEDELNDRSLLDRHGVDAIYADDFHHQVHVRLTEEQDSYYDEYSGKIEDLVETMNQSWWFIGQRSARRKGQRVGVGGTRGIPRNRFIWCLENHDQVGNRPYGERLGQLAPPAVYRAVSALCLLTPHVPLLFMGQEWGASTPFVFFADHEQPLGDEIAASRLRDFSASFPNLDPVKVQHPQARATFKACQLKWPERLDPRHAQMRTLYKELLRIREERKVAALLDRTSFSCRAFDADTLELTWNDGIGGPMMAFANLGSSCTVNLKNQYSTRRLLDERWVTLIDTEDAKFGGRGDTKITRDSLIMNGPRFVLFVTPNSFATHAPAPAAEKYDVFVSYADANRDRAEEIRQALVRVGKRVFFAGSEIAAGDRWKEKLQIALEQAPVLAVLITPESVKSQWVLVESAAAWASRKRVIVILYRCSPESLPEHLRDYQAKDIDKFVKDPVID